MRLLAIALGCCLALSSAPALADDGDGGGGSRVPAYVATGVTAGLLITTAVSYFKYTFILEDQDDIFEYDRQKWEDSIEAGARWRTIHRVSIGATIIAGGVTGYLWTRAEKKPTRNITVTANEHGGGAWLTGTF